MRAADVSEQIPGALDARGSKRRGRQDSSGPSICPIPVSQYIAQNGDYLLSGPAVRPIGESMHLRLFFHLANLLWPGSKMHLLRSLIFSISNTVDFRAQQVQLLGRRSINRQRG